LVQHLPDVTGDVHDPGPGAYAERHVRTLEGSRVHQLLGEAAFAHCHHHQAVDRRGEGLTATAWAADGTIEAVELAGPTWCLGVQWHPEAGEERRLFGALIDAAATARPQRPAGVR
jgi:putative glutamine amidotransferase